MFVGLASEVVRIFSNFISNLDKHSFTYLLFRKKHDTLQDPASSFTINRSNNNGLNRHGGNLANITEESMRKLRVILVNKPSIPIPAVDAALITLNRRLENPHELTVPSDGSYPIFNRTDIDVNNEENLDERIELTLHDNSVIKDTEYKRNHFTNAGERSRRVIKYTKEEQKEDYKYKRFTNQHGSMVQDTKRRSRERQEKSNRKRRRPREGEQYIIRSLSRSPSRTRRKYDKTACDDRHCSCNKTSKSKERNQSPKFKETMGRENPDVERYRSRRRSSSRERTTHSSRDYTKERSNRSSYSRIDSHSPQSRKGLSSTKHFERRRTHRRSISPGQSHDRSNNTSPSKYIQQYGMPPHSFGYPGVHGLWWPQPHFVHGPRMSLMGGPRYFVPRPPMFIPPTYHQFRPHVLPDQHILPVPNGSRSCSVTQSQSVIEEPSSTSHTKK